MSAAAFKVLCGIAIVLMCLAVRILWDIRAVLERYLPEEEDNPDTHQQQFWIDAPPAAKRTDADLRHCKRTPGCSRYVDHKGPCNVPHHPV